MWVGGVSGGVWKTVDSGRTWSTNTDQLANLSVSCMAMDPTNPDILYAGTGESFFPGAYGGKGIFKTTDGGNYWQLLSSTEVNPTNMNFAFVNRLAISPADHQLLLAATSSGVFRSTDGGGQWSQCAGIPNGVWNDVRFQPINGIAEPEIPDVPAINCLAASRTGQLYYSADNGATWATNPGNGLPAPGGDQRTELAYSRSTPMIVYASAAGSQITSELFRSVNGGYSFASLGHPQGPFDPLPGANGYTSALWVDPINPDTVVVGGVYLLRTMDRGAHWEECDALSHVDTHVLVEHPGYNRGTGTAPNAILYSGNDGGLHRTSNILAAITPIPHQGSVVWSSLNSSLGVTQFYGAAGNAATGVILGGTQDNGTVRFFGNPENWDNVRGGDGGFCAADQVGESEQPYYYGEGYFLAMHRSTTATGKAQDIWGGKGHPNGIPGCTNPQSNLPCANFTAPFILDPNNRERILAGGRSLWRTNNARADNPLLVRWDEIKPRYPVNCTDFCVPINAVAVAEADSNIIWVGDNNGSVFYTTNGTASSPTWNQVDGTVLPDRMCTRITIAHPLPGDPPDVVATVYATFAGFFPSNTDGKGNVWKRETNGTWTDIHHNLPSTPVLSLVVSPSDPDILYIGTEIGVFASSNGGASWSPALGTPARTRVVELFWMGPKLVAATHGRGIFTLSPPGN
jgi:hypothetical protein